MIKKPSKVILFILVFLFSTLFTFPQAYAEQEDYLDSLIADLANITDTSVSSSASNSEYRSEAGTQSDDLSQVKTTITDNDNEANRNVKLTHITTSGKHNTTPVLIGKNGNGLKNNTEIDIANSSQAGVSADMGLIKKSDRAIVNDVNYLKEFIATSTKSDLGYYYKINNEGSGKNACAGAVTFSMQEDNDMGNVISQGTFNIKCSLLPVVIGDALGKIKKHGEVEILTSAYQIYKNDTVKNGYKNNTLLKYKIMSIK